MLTDCNGFAIRVYMYVIIGVFMFNSAAIWSAKRYSKNLAELSSASIGIAITTWIAAVTVLYNLDYRFWAVKHIAIIILSVLTGAFVGIVAKWGGYEDSITRTASLITTFIIAVIIAGIIGGTQCISPRVYLYCIIISLAIAELSSFYNFIKIGAWDETKSAILEFFGGKFNIERGISIGIFLHIFVYVKDIVKRVCKGSYTCIDGKADYVDIVMEPYKSFTSFFIDILIA